MNLPIHDNLGVVNPEKRQDESEDSITPEEFIQHSQGKTFEQLNSESIPRTIIHQTIPIIVDGGVDYKFRFVQDPTDPGGVIDMLHFMNAARVPFSLGEWAGLAVEVNQARKSDISAFLRNDFKSNFLGTVFRSNYFDPNGDLSQQFQEFFTDLENGELKGIVPATEYFIADVIDLAKDGYRAIEQLENIINLHLDRLNNSESIQKLRDLMDRLEEFVELPAYTRDAEGGFDQATALGRQPIDPLVLDLDGDGIELTSVDNHVVRFDIDGDGFGEATGWVHSDDGLLVLDRNGDGLINDISELFGNQTTSGFVALRGIDSNADGFIDTAEPNFSHLQVWRDLDSDGRSDGNELFTLDELGISRIRTAASSTNITNAGNQITETSHFELADGSQREIANVGFSVDQLNSYYDPYSTFSNPVVFTEEILSLPNLMLAGVT